MKNLPSFILVLCFTSQLFAQDSLKTNLVNEQKTIIHKVEQGQTLFSIARKYNVSVADIKTLNPTVTQIKTGSSLFIPAKTVKETITPSQVLEPKPKETRGSDEGQQTIHKVGPGETLYGISKKYNVTVFQISEVNEIGSKGISPGQSLTIPQQTNKSTPKAELKTYNQQTHSTLPQQIKTEKKTSLTGYPAVTETGTALFDETLPSETYQVYHKSAKIGTLVMLKNKETGLVAHAKVTGTNKGQELVVINKKVYEKLECKSKSITVEVFYTPED